MCIISVRHVSVTGSGLNVNHSVVDETRVWNQWKITKDDKKRIRFPKSKIRRKEWPQISLDPGCHILIETDSDSDSWIEVYISRSLFQVKLAISSSLEKSDQTLRLEIIIWNEKTLCSGVDSVAGVQQLYNSSNIIIKLCRGAGRIWSRVLRVVSGRSFVHIEMKWCFGEFINSFK